METIKIIAIQVALWTGVGGLVVVASGLVFWFAYGSAFSPRGAAAILAYAMVATIVGQRFSGLSWSQLGAIGIVFLGLALASAPIRSFPLSELEGKDLSFIVLGIAMIVTGFGSLSRIRKTKAIPK